MPTRRTFLASGAALAATAALPECLLARPQMAPGDLARDVDILRQALLALHPGLFRYQAPARFDRRVEALRSWAAAPRTIAAFYLELARFTAAIRCGHTFPNPFNQARRIREALFSGRDRIPFHFVWLDGRMIVTGGFADTPLRPGDEVTAIDGIPARWLLADLLPLARADGSNDGKRVAQMQLLPGERNQSFDIYRPLLFPRPDGEVRVSVLGAARPLRLAAMTEAERQRDSVSRSDPGWRFEIERGIGRLTMPTWSVYNSPFDWRGFLKAALDRLAAEQPRGLIVDLRGNEGGLDCGDPLLAHLIDAPLMKPGYRSRVRYRSVPIELRPLLDTYDQEFFDWGKRAVGPAPDGFYELSDEDGSDRTILPAAPRLTAPVAILSDAVNSSATFNFLQIVKDNKLATIVGGASGGNRRGLNGSAYFFLRLPKSGIEIDIPLVGSFPVASQPDEGIAPDIAVANSGDDYRAGRDRVMAAALATLG